VERSFGFEVRTDKLFPQDVDPAKWWTRKAETVQFVPGEVCDGKWLLTSMDATRRLAFPPGTEEGGHIHMIDNHPEYLARPLPPLTPLDEVKVNPKPTSGPPNTVLLEVHAAHPQPGHHGPQIWRYWIDPEQGHLVMRYEELVLREGKEEIIRGHAIEGVTQDPGGQWYPTVIRLFKRNILVGSDKPHDGIMRCYYDFVTPMPDSLFKVD
jgi:hypothetical protein